MSILHEKKFLRLMYKYSLLCNTIIQLSSKQTRHVRSCMNYCTLHFCWAFNFRGYCIPSQKVRKMHPTEIKHWCPPSWKVGKESGYPPWKFFEILDCCRWVLAHYGILNDLEMCVFLVILGTFSGAAIPLRNIYTRVTPHAPPPLHPWSCVFYCLLY